MPGLVAFLRCVGRSAVKNGGRALASLLPFGEAAFEIARDACEDYRRVHGEDQLRQELQELVSASHDEVHHAAQEAATQEAGGQPVEVRLALASYLDRVPATLPGRQQTPAAAVESGRHTYTLRGLLAAGDVADVYFGQADDSDPAKADCVVKVSRIPGGHTFLADEAAVLDSLQAAAGGSTYRAYLPGLVESFVVQDRFAKRVNVFRYEPGLYTLEQVHAQHPAMDGRHLAWIFNRLLTVLGFCHRHGAVHGAVLPCHVLIHAANHGLRLVGWGQSVEVGQPLTAVSTRYRNWYPPEVLKRQPTAPATDLFLAARCVVYLAGGDPLTGKMPDSVPAPLRRFVAACLLEGIRMRPNDAWALMDELNDLLGRLYGPPSFCELNMKEGE